MSRKSCPIYSNATTDIEFLFPFGWGELWGIADRTDFDLTQHQNTSGKFLWNTSIRKPTRQYIPYVIEPSLGADRVALAFLCDAYDEEVVGQMRRARMTSAWFCVCIRLWLRTRLLFCRCPRSWHDQATPVYEELSKHFMVDYDEAGSIGKRYRREDEIGTPFCITVDFETETDGCVTIRDRDTMEQIRLPIAEVKDYIAKKCEF